MSVDILGTSQLWPMPKPARFNKSLRPWKPEGSLGRTAQDGNLDSHTAPELWFAILVSTSTVIATPTQKSARKCAATSRDFFAEKSQSAFTLANQLRWIAHIALHLQAKAQAHNPCYQKTSKHPQTCEELSILPPSNSCYSHSMHHTAQGKLVCKIPSMSMINFPTAHDAIWELNKWFDYRICVHLQNPSSVNHIKVLTARNTALHVLSAPCRLHFVLK